MNHPDRRAENAPRQLSIGCEIGGAACRVAVHEWGRPDAERVVLCLHALNRNGRDFDFLARALAADRRVLCPDLPGRGDSDRLADPADYNHQTYLRVLHALADRPACATGPWTSLARRWAGYWA